MTHHLFANRLLGVVRETKAFAGMRGHWGVGHRRLIEGKLESNLVQIDSLDRSKSSRLGHVTKPHRQGTRPGISTELIVSGGHLRRPDQKLRLFVSGEGAKGSENATETASLTRLYR